MGYLLIIRPINCIIAFVSVLVGAWIGNGIFFSPRLILAGMIMFGVYAFGNMVNDLYDLEIDKINRPERPLPSGKVNAKIVVLLALFFLVISILFSINLGLLPLFLVIGICSLLFVYDTYLKKTVIGNFIVALITGLGFVLGGIVARNPSCIVPFLFSLFIHTPREIIKDIIDIKGDEAFGIISLPILMGKERSLKISALLVGILCILLPLPFIFKILSIRYMLIVLLCAYPILIFAIVMFLKRPEERMLTKLSNLLKISMAVGLVAMIA